MDKVELRTYLILEYVKRGANTLKQHANGCHLEHPFTGLDGGFIIFVQTPPPGESTELAFDHPALGLYLKAHVVGIRSHNGEDKMTPTCHIVDQGALIDTISPDSQERRKGSIRFLQNLSAACRFRPVAPHDHDHQQPAQRISQHKAFPPFHLFGLIKAPGGSFAGGFDRLAIKQGSGGHIGVSRQIASEWTQCSQYLIPDAGTCPDQIIVDRMIVRDVCGQHVSLAPGIGEVENGIDDLAGTDHTAGTRIVLGHEGPFGSIRSVL